MFNTTFNATDFLKELNDLTWITSRDGRLTNRVNYQYKDGVLEVELPGWAKDEVEIEIEGLGLYISGSTENETRFRRNFKHSFSLPESLDTSDVKATMEHGILRIEFSTEVKPTKKVNIL